MLGIFPVIFLASDITCVPYDITERGNVTSTVGQPLEILSLRLAQRTTTYESTHTAHHRLRPRPSPPDGGGVGGGVGDGVGGGVGGGGGGCGGSGGDGSCLGCRG